jgi:hypothetical protein
MSPTLNVRMLVRTAIPLTVMALAACGASTPSASNPTGSPANSPAAGATAACTVAAVMVPISAAFNTATTQATAYDPNDLKCASGIARLTVLIGPINPPANGPQGTQHLVLLEDHTGRWVIANDTLCNSQGYSTKKTPPQLGILCGFP